MSWEDYIPDDIKVLFEIHEFNHAAAILAHEFPNEFNDLCNALRQFRFTEQDVKEKGGSESQIPKKFSLILRPLGWLPEELEVKKVVNNVETKASTHEIDYVKGRVALDLEWNSKDQTFDRDLYAFRAFFDNDRISLGIIITRSNELDPWFKSLGTYEENNKIKKYSAKYGASTTQMGKLLPRLVGGRHGGCPVLVFGIQTKSLLIQTQTI